MVWRPASCTPPCASRSGKSPTIRVASGIVSALGYRCTLLGRGACPRASFGCGHFSRSAIVAGQHLREDAAHVVHVAFPGKLAGSFGTALREARGERRIVGHLEQHARERFGVGG